jgi:rRNA small subunit pseudouridine methyltransferase Nep1
VSRPSEGTQFGLQGLTFVYAVQLLHKLSIRSVNSPEKLLKVIKNPVTDHLPPNCRKITLSADAKVIKLSEYVPTLPSDTSTCFFIGSFAHGPDNFADDMVDEKISISNYNLSAATSCAKICEAFESLWEVL